MVKLAHVAGQAMTAAEFAEDCAKFLEKHARDVVGSSRLRMTDKAQSLREFAKNQAVLKFSPGGLHHGVRWVRSSGRLELSNTTKSDAPVFPMFVYIYEADGTYGDPVQINSEAQLHGPDTRIMIKVAMEQKREIRITDPGDLMLFHAKDGRILFDGKEVKE